MMALKKLPKAMSYEAIRHKHPPTPNHTPDPDGTETGKTDDVEQSLAPTKEKRETPFVQSEEPVAEKPVEPSPEKAAIESPRQESETARKPASGKPKSIRVRGYVQVPAFGDHASFDKARELYGEKHALGVALSRGMEAYAVALNGTGSLPAVPHRSGGLNTVEASRTMATELYNKAVTHVDPQGMLGRSQLGSRVLQTAMTYFLADQ